MVPAEEQKNLAPAETLLITGADAKYFDLAQGCIRSVLAQPQRRHIALAFLDMGCSETQLAWLRAHVDLIRRADWEFDFPMRDKTPAYLKGVLARPCLRKYFPGHETYIWLDADTWVQDWRAIELLQEGARNRRGMAIVPELNRACQIQFGGLARYWDKAYSWYEAGHGRALAAQLHTFPMLNSGAIAIHQAAPHWDIWTEELQQALQRTCTTITEQIALNVAVYARGLFEQTELLPAWCNWACHYGLPKWDQISSRLVEPYMPHTPIGIMHLTVHKQKRASLTTTAGNKIDICLNYPAGPSFSPPHTDTGSPLSDQGQTWLSSPR